MVDTARLEADDIQTLIFHGYIRLEGAEFVLLRAEDPARARSWLRSLIDWGQVTAGNPEAPERVTQIAFTAPGLVRLGLDREVVAGFPLAFRDGMFGRDRILGDAGDSSPSRWDWGGTEESVPHALLLAYASTPEAAARHASEILGTQSGWQAHSLPRSLMLPLRSSFSGKRTNVKEHFGFDDGIGDPEISGVRSSGRPQNEVAAGEFVLGYPDQAGEIPRGPSVPPGGAGGAALPHGDLGRNGSYLVVRQLEQHVYRFWEFLQRGRGLGEAERLAAKMVGRWRNGAPLARWSASQPDRDLDQDDDFLYASDPNGFGCPLGAHIRRTNPRDAVPFLDPERSLRASLRRRILRRGRTYGEPAKDWLDPAKIQKDGASRGLHFLCLCADLDRQFEFVQQTWVSSRKLGQLANDADPLLANPAHPIQRSSEFTVQASPLSQRIGGLEQFVTVRGGAYFFLPGLRALRHLAGVPG